MTQLTDSSSGNLGWGYDGLDRITSAVTPQGTIGYTYDAVGRRTSMAPAAQAIVNYVYDNANRRTSLILPNAVSIVYGYDAANQLTGINYLSPTNTAMGALAYGYDLDGRRISKSGSFATDVLPASNSAAGTFDLNNRETTFNGTTQSYDANGNLTSNGVDTFVWNARNQLTQITESGNTKFSYAYDALGRRTSKSVIGATAPTTYLYDGMNAVQEVIGNATNPVLTGLGMDERFARNDVNGRTDLLTDALNSTIALTDPTGAITQQYSYDPYGNVTQSNTTAGFTNPYLYAGREADSTGLYYYRARYYSPTMGRFISEDPVGFGGGQNNFYAYVNGDPVSNSDASGQKVVVNGNPVNYNMAINYLSADSEMAQTIGDLNASSTTYTIQYINDGNDRFDPSSNTVYWDPNSALLTTNGGTQTPALGLGHEMGHADASFWDNLIGWIPWPGYDDLEERRVITGLETHAAKTLCEGTRNDHGGTLYNVANPISR